MCKFGRVTSNLMVKLYMNEQLVIKKIIISQSIAISVQNPLPRTSSRKVFGLLRWNQLCNVSSWDRGRKLHKNLGKPGLGRRGMFHVSGKTKTGKTSTCPVEEATRMLFCRSASKIKTMMTKLWLPFLAEGTSRREDGKYVEVRRRSLSKAYSVFWWGFT